MKEQFVEVPLWQLVNSPTNPRNHYPEPELLELGASIKKNGIISPLTIRKLPDKYKKYVTGEPLDSNPHYYEAVAGNRRIKSMRLEAYADHFDDGYLVPCMLKELTDEEVLNIQIDENAQRQDLTAMDEAVVFHELLDKHRLSVNELSERFSKSAQYIHTRSSLVNLIKEWKAVFADDRMTIGIAIAISRLKDKEQKQFYKEKLNQFDKKEEIELIDYNDVIFDIRRKFYLKLEEAWFDLEKQYGKLPLCAACPNNTACQDNASLFPDLTTGNCLDVKCFDKKTKAHLEGQYQSYVEQCKAAGQKQLIFLSQDWSSYKKDNEKAFKRSGIPQDAGKVRGRQNWELVKGRRKKNTLLAYVLIKSWRSDDLMPGMIVRIDNTPKKPNRFELSRKEEQRKRKIENRISNEANELVFKKLEQKITKKETLDVVAKRNLLNFMMDDIDWMQEFFKYFPESWHGFVNEHVQKHAEADYKKLSEKPETKPAIKLKTFTANYCGNATHGIIMPKELFNVIGQWRVRESGLMDYVAGKIPEADLDRALNIALFVTAKNETWKDFDFVLCKSNKINHKLIESNVRKRVEKEEAEKLAAKEKKAAEKKAKADTAKPKKRTRKEAADVAT